MNDKKFVTYEDFGAVGDGVTQDYAAICRAHNYANEMGLPVKAKSGAKYYINDPRIDGVMTSAIIKTDVDWSDAEFIIDDRDILYATETDSWRGHTVFKVAPDEERYKIDDPEILRKVSGKIKPNAKVIDLGLPYPAMIVPYASTHKVFRRLNYAGWQGASMHELIVIDKDGNVSEETPIMFDYGDIIDYIEVVRLDVKPITITGGIFRSITCTQNILRFKDDGTAYNVAGYVARNINVNRSYTIVKGVQHYIEGELPMNEQVDENGNIKHVCCPYSGFFLGTYGDHITFEDCIITGRRAYNYYTGGACGTYSISGNCVNKIVFKNCQQSNFWVTVDENHMIHPAKEGDEGAVTSMSGHMANGKWLMMHWGIGGTNFCKNMEYIDCTLSRYDAHCGLYNGKIINSTINGIEVVGYGDLLMENTRWFARESGTKAGAGNSVFYLRDDYASTWDGEMKIINCKGYSRADDEMQTYILCHSYNNWYYGYQARFPNILLENFKLFNMNTGEPLSAGTEINLVGNSLDKEPMMNAEYTANCNSIYPLLDVDGDGLVDGTDIPFVEGDGRRGVLHPTSKKNLNPVIPPQYIKVIRNSESYKLIVKDTSDYEGGGFFGNTQFVSDTETIIGTKICNDTFKFR